MHSIEIQDRINALQNNFPINLYNKYICGDISYTQLLKLINCSDYILKIVRNNLSLPSRRNYNNTMTNHTIFDKIDTEQKAYILGFYIADGCVINGKYLQFMLNNKDLQILKDIKNILNPNARLIYAKSRINNYGIKTNNMVGFKICSKHIVDILNEYGIGQRKTYLNKSIINIVPKELMWHFIRGYFDGDGMIGAYYITKKHKCKDGSTHMYNFYNYNYTIVSHDQYILQEILDFYKSEDIDAILYQEKRGGNYLVGTHSFVEIKKVFKKLYSNATIYLQRKYDKFKQVIENTEVINETKKSLTLQSVEIEPQI